MLAKVYIQGVQFSFCTGDWPGKGGGKEGREKEKTRLGDLRKDGVASDLIIKT